MAAFGPAPGVRMGMLRHVTLSDNLKDPRTAFRAGLSRNSPVDLGAESGFDSRNVCERENMREGL